MKKVGCVIVSLLLLLCGCNRSNPQISQNTDIMDVTLKGVEKTTSREDVFSFEMLHQSSINQESWSEWLNEFGAIYYPNATFKATVLPDPNRSLVTRMVTGDYPDLLLTSVLSVQIQEMMSADIFLPLNDYSELTEKIEDDFLKLSIFRDGNIYTIPWTLNGFGIFYNKDIFAECGITELPETIEELYEVCDILLQNDVLPFYFTDGDTQMLPQQFDRMYIGGADRTPWEKYKSVCDGTYSFVEDMALRKYAETIVKLRSYGQANSLEATGEQGKLAFTEGKCAMMQEGTWATGYLHDLNPDLNYGIMKPPAIAVEKEEVKSAGAFGDGFCVIKGMEHEDVALELIHWFTEKENAQRYVDVSGELLVIKDTHLKDPVMEDYWQWSMDGNWTLAGSTQWSINFRAEQLSLVQQLILDGDVESFLMKYDQLIKNFYS